MSDQGPEIEITPEMVKAGIGVLNGYEPGWVKPSDMVKEIYEVMTKAGSTHFPAQNP